MGEAPSNRRKERRYPLDLQADLAVLSYAGVSSLAVRTVNVSRSGLALRAPRPLGPATEVRIKWPSFAAFGAVRYCRRIAADEFEIGVKLTDTFHGAAPPLTDHIPPEKAALLLADMLSEQESRLLRAHARECMECGRMLDALTGRTGAP